MPLIPSYPLIEAGSLSVEVYIERLKLAKKRDEVGPRRTIGS
jgi:hypothetical protein